MANSFPDKLLPGAAYPLGANWDGLGVNFAVFSANAQKIEVCLFDTTGRKELARFELPECTDEIWHGYLPGAHPGTVYGFRAHGPYLPHHGHRFNPHKLLLDPYAKKLVGQWRWSDALFGYRVHSNRLDLSMDRRDSAPATPKCVVTDDAFDWSRDTRPNVPWGETVIYETHVRGTSMLRQDIRQHERGSFAALSSPWFIEHLQKLGITAVEFLPVHAFLNDRFLVGRGLKNYWGYNTAAFFAPEPAYLSTNRLNEMRIAVRRLHAAGIEVILDVVYNHTCEGNELGPTVSWRGLDNASYYRLIPGDERRYINETGCGNTVNLSHPRVLQMVMDSLRYWATAFNVDGFRFDLGVTLGREGHGFDPGSGFFDAIRQDPILNTRKMISEPWDIGPDGYQVGNHPPGFAEWNDKFRDGIRRFWRGDAGVRPDLAARLTGSAELFHRRMRKPWASVNFVASHDGFTVADVTSYEQKHNELNQEGNNDGHNENCSANWGEEGPTADPDILETRGRVARALIATNLLSLGTPMLLAGDEIGRTQRGNNNAYCQDKEFNWIDWQDLGAETEKLRDFVRKLVKLRREHFVFRRGRFFHGSPIPGTEIKDITWLRPDGTETEQQDWQRQSAHFLSFALSGEAGQYHLTAAGEPEIDDTFLAIMNAHHEPISYRMPSFDTSLAWELAFDTSMADGLDSSARQFKPGDTYAVTPRSFVLLVRQNSEAGKG